MALTASSGGAGGNSGSEPASATGVAVVSSAGADKTYGLGEKIQVRATLDETVDVTGSPRLKIKMDPRWGEFWAGYESGRGTARAMTAPARGRPAGPAARAAGRRSRRARRVQCMCIHMA